MCTGYDTQGVWEYLDFFNFCRERKGGFNFYDAIRNF